MARNYADEYEREQKRYRRLTVRIPADLAEAFYACCELDDIKPTDWVLNKILDYARRDLTLGVVSYHGFLFDWNELVADMDPVICRQLRDVLPPGTTNEEFLAQYGEIDPSIYETIDPFGAPPAAADHDN